MHTKDECKTTFMTELSRYCYKVMPFGLKNASATYQRLEELFTTIAKYRLKLNPEKCVFGVKAGRFLGFLLTERGIEANPC